ncbi:protein PAT1 homolog 1-like [Diadema setosum]|uniref:protein PAT1 homolog 1-like n=1 Tax=Diadema setosum TaxID=31175 RepID=UPI003B3B6CD4
MTDTLFGFDADLPPLDEGPEEDEGDYYDNVNDDTFGAGADAGDWEDAHERMAEDFRQEEEIPGKGGRQDGVHELIPFFEEEDLEKSITQLVLDDDDNYYDPALKKTSQSKPISIKGAGESNISQLFGPKSPPSLFDPTNFMSPTRNIWGSPEVGQTVELPSRQPLTVTSTEDRLKAMLNIGQGAKSRPSDAWEDPAIVRAVGEVHPPKVISLAELEQELTGGKGTSSKALPARSVSPEIGSPPAAIPLPIGTPPRGASHMHQARLPGTQPQKLPPDQHKQLPQFSHAPPHATPPSLVPQQQQNQSPIVPIHPQLLQQLTRQIHQSIGGRVSPTQISQLIIRLHASGGRISPNSIRQAVFTTIPPPRDIPRRAPPPGQPGNMAGSPGFGGSPRPPPYSGSPRMPYSSSPRGMPMGPGPGTSPSSNTPPMHAAGRGRGPFPRAMHGLTPMNPRIPPVHSRPDQMGMNRRYPYGSQQRGPQANMQKYDRGDGPRAQRQIRFQRGGNQHRGGNRGDYDEYSCLMSTKEKEWVIKIQMLQLTSNNPAVDDFYFQNYMQRKAAKEKDREESGKSQQEGGKKEKKLVLKPLENKVYQPAQFEGALGKLTTSSVNNPRQIIDIHIDNAAEDEEGGKPGAKDHGRRRRTLLAIERLYGIVLVIEELDQQVGGLPESDTGPLLEKRKGLISQMCAMLRGEGLKDRTVNSHFHQMLGIRKGRKLVGRVLPLLGKEESLPLLQSFLGSLSYVFKQEAKDLKKDAQENQKGRVEETLPQLFDPISQVIQSCDLGDLAALVENLESQLPTTPTTPQNKSSSFILNAVQNKLGVSIVLCMINHAEELYTVSKDASAGHANWVESVQLIAQAICMVSDAAIARPLGRFPNILDHFSRFVSKQPLNALEKRLRNLIDNEE